MNGIRRSMAVLAASALIAALAAPASGGNDPAYRHHDGQDHHQEHHGEVHHDAKAHDPAGAHGHSENPLIEEMMKLDAVFRDVVSAVSLGDGHRVQEALNKMHGTMEKTHEGVHHGTVTLKKNADKLDEFVELDKQFHARLERLAHAAHKNDQAAMASLTKELLDRCIGCHREFRQP